MLVQLEKLGEATLGEEDGVETPSSSMVTQANE